MSQESIDSEENLDYHIKIILLGTAGVGKTNLINITIGQGFNEAEKTTTASSFSVKKIILNNQEYRINLWDTIGQEQFRQLTKIFFNNSKIVLYVYDITRKASFDALPSWIKDVNEQIGNDYIKGIVANKSDLYYNEEVKTEEGQELANIIGGKFLLISAKHDDPKKFEDFLVELIMEYISKKKRVDSRNFSITKRKTLENTDKANCCK